MSRIIAIAMLLASASYGAFLVGSAAASFDNSLYGNLNAKIAAAFHTAGIDR